MSKKQGFSLVEALIITLIVSSAVAASLPVLTTKIQENDKSLSALGVKDSRFWKRTKNTGDHIYYNGSVGAFVNNEFIREESKTFNNGKTLVLGQKTGTTTNNLSAITAYGKYGYGEDVPTGAGTRFIWSSKYGAFRAGYVNGSQWDPARLGLNSFAFGLDNIASGSFSKVYSGRENIASGAYSGIFGGQNNQTSASNSKIFGGKNNLVEDPYSEIFAGENNHIENCTVSGDGDNDTTKNVIVAGSNNTIKSSANYAMIIAGNGTVVDEPYVVSVGKIDEKLQELNDNTSLALHTSASGSANIKYPTTWDFNQLINDRKIHLLNTFNGSHVDKLLVQDEDGRDENPDYYMSFIFNNNKYILLNKNGVTETYRYSSDRRLKKDIKDYKSGIDEVLKLEPVSYKYKDNRTDETIEGFIAQDVKKLYPQTVKKDKKGFYKIESTLLYEKIRLSLINATKEMANKITSLEKDSDKITDEVEKMKIRLEKMEKIKSNA